MTALTQSKPTRRWRWPSIWSVGAAAIALPIAVPIVAVMLTFFTPSSEVWQHLRESVLTEYILNTAVLLALVGLLVGVVGVACAWLVATRDFPGRNILVWALILPFAAPAYVVAYAYADLLAYASPLQTALRDVGILSSGLPAVRSLPGAALVLGLTLYPYVYLFAYGAFSQQARPLTEAARMLGASRGRAFFSIALPHARPAIAGGIALALMETAADFGVVDFYGVPTLTNGIFRTWYAQGEHQAAMQLAGWLFMVVLLLVMLERFARRGSYANPVSRNHALPLEPLRGPRGWGAILLCATPVVLGFVLPVAVLAGHAIDTGDPVLGKSFTRYVVTSLGVAGIAAIIAALCAVFLTYGLRLHAGRWLKLCVQTATLGYALPGMVLAIGLIGPLTRLDKWLASGFEALFDWRSGLLLTGSAAVLIFVYLARFLTVAYNSCDSGLARIHPHYDSAARSLGAGRTRLLLRVHTPMMMPAILTAVLLVFVDVIKELPATLILRPFNFETLATRAYRLASDERIAEASTAALCLVAAGVIPALLIARQNFGRSAEPSGDIGT